MTVHHPSLLRTNPAEPKLRWLLLASFAVHAVILAVFLGTPPDSSEKVFFSPVYTVNLVEMPTMPGGSRGPGRATGSGAPLWEGPGTITSQVKTLKKRAHTITITKKDPEKEPRQQGKSTDAAGPGSSPGDSQATGPAQGLPGGSPTGGTPSAASLRFSLYYQSVWNKIQAAWVLPHYGGTKKLLEAIVNINIDRSGRILHMSFEKKSGDANFDRSVLRAVKKADPLPQLPAGLRKTSLEIGIRFTNEERTP